MPVKIRATRRAVLGASLAASFANERDGYDKIVLPASDRPYKLTRSGADEDAARKGDLDLADDELKIRGKSAKRSVIKQTAADRVFELVPTTGTNSVGIETPPSTVSGNRADSFAGGVMTAATDGSANVISGTTIEGNRAPRGGGVLTRPGDANLHVIDSTITANLSPLPDPALSYSSGGGLTSKASSPGAGS